MKILIQQARIIDPASPFHLSVQDILISNGKIAEIGTALPEESDKIIREENLCVSPGWVDIFSNFADPGYEQKETLESGSAAAAAGGFTDVFLVPDTKPVLDSKSQIEYIRRSHHLAPVTLYPIGAISKGLGGKELAEMYDMHASGAIAFSDGWRPVQSAGLLMKALQYIRAVNGIIIQIPDDRTIGTHGLMNEGIVSTTLGLPGKPIMAEEIAVARDIKLAKYAGSRLHFTGISSPKSLEYIRRGKESGLDITCSVTPYHLFFTEDDLFGYDTNLKVFPPLRGADAREALREAVTDGTIDCISSHHSPQDSDNKLVEFEYAKFGMIGLETCYAALTTAMPEVSQEKWVELLCTNPRKIFGLPEQSIRPDNPACMSLFVPGRNVERQGRPFRSRSQNSAFHNIELYGSILGIINNDRVFLTENHA